VLGTPTEKTWPGISKLPDFKPTFPRWTKNHLERKSPNLCAKGRDLLEKMLAYDPADRITAKDALNHVFIISSLSITLFSLTSMILIKQK
jgi:serine/threonine protein kinase